MAGLIYKRKFYENFIVKKYISLSIRITHFFDGIRDKRICGCSLVKNVPSAYRETMGATSSVSTSYWALDRIFKGVTFTGDDRFIDVGCGKGRILAYMADRGFPCELAGIELNREVYEYARAWTEKYDNITLIQGDAFAQDYNGYTVLFLARPFETKAFIRFVTYLEETLEHSIRLFYWWDGESGGYLENRPGWTKGKREIIFASHGLFMYRCPQRYTIWEYDPKEK